ncbi:MAG: hypothetical protein RMK84_08085 [Oscillochloridaceae bacterium]|nr:hypothetical protein [Chloroflexaceae bacterium]MDW8390071.1 hypothetical protein [Oscillochloridaceae bacterium]
MPNDIWQDVRWDHGAATEAVAALQRTAGEIDRALAEIAQTSREAATDWLGPHREFFEHSSSRLRGELTAIAAACRRAAADVQHASARAHEEQARRLREREEHERREREERERRQRERSGPRPV